MGYNPSSRYHPVSKWGTDVVATAGAGVFVNLNDQQADEVTILVLAAGVGLDIQSAGQVGSNTKYVSVDAPSGITIALTGNALEVLVRRTDGSATPVNVRYIWRKFGR